MFARTLIALLILAAPAAADDIKPDVKTKLEGHRGGVTALAFAPNGEVVATGSGNGLVRLWNAADGKLVTKLDPFSGTKVGHIGFSADGKFLSAASRKSVTAWALTDPAKPLERFSDNYAESAYKFGGVSGDGRRVYYPDSGGVLRYHDLKDSGSTLTDHKDMTRQPLAFATIPDTESALAAILYADSNKKAAVVFVGLGDKWQLSEGLKPVDANPDALSFAPDGKWLAVCTGGGVAVWRVPGSQKVSGKPRSVLAGAGPYTAIAAGPNGVLAVAEKGFALEKARVHLLDLTADEPAPVQFATFATGIEDISALAFAPDGKRLAVADTVEGVVQVWALPAKK